MSAKATTADPQRIEKIAGVPLDNLEREHGSTHLWKNGSMCNRCSSRVQAEQMVPLHDAAGVKSLTCPHCGGELVKLNRDEH